MIKKKDFGSEKNLRIFIQLIVIFLLQMGQSPQKRAIDEKHINVCSVDYELSKTYTLKFVLQNFMVRLVYQLCTCVFNTSFDRS